MTETDCPHCIEGEIEVSDQAAKVCPYCLGEGVVWGDREECGV